MDGRENKDLRRRKPRNQRSVRLQLRAVVAAGQDCAVAAEPCGDAASLQSPARNDRQVDQLEPSITGRWTLRQSGVAAISKGETGLPQAAVNEAAPGKGFWAHAICRALPGS